MIRPTSFLLVLWTLSSSAEAAPPEDKKAQRIDAARRTLGSLATSSARYLTVFAGRSDRVVKSVRRVEIRQEEGRISKSTQGGRPSTSVSIPMSPDPSWFVNLADENVLITGSLGVDYFDGTRHATFYRRDGRWSGQILKKPMSMLYFPEHLRGAFYAVVTPLHDVLANWEVSEVSAGWGASVTVAVNPKYRNESFVFVWDDAHPLIRKMLTFKGVGQKEITRLIVGAKDVGQLGALAQMRFEYSVLAWASVAGLQIPKMIRIHARAPGSGSKSPAVDSLIFQVLEELSTGGRNRLVGDLPPPVKGHPVQVFDKLLRVGFVYDVSGNKSRVQVKASVESAPDSTAPTTSTGGTSSAGIWLLMAGGVLLLAALLRTRRRLSGPGRRS